MALREQGRSFAAIARTLGLKRAADARQAFLRELRSRSDEERQHLVERELERLDKLEARIRARDVDEPEKLQTRLGALAAMRESLR
jgi:DNA-binding transcriptional MerR regulator